MDGNTDAQLRKYIVKYQQNLVSKPKNDIITPTKHVIHLDKKENLSNYDLTKIAPAQDKHVVGTNSYKNLSETRAYAPSYLTISPNKISELVAKYAGKGVNLYDSHGNWTHTELIVTNDENIGVVVNNLNGKTQETKVHDMIAKDFEKYIEKKVLVMLTDGRGIAGELDSIAPDYDTESGKDELELFIEGAYIVVPVDEVESIKMV